MDTSADVARPDSAVKTIPTSSVDTTTLIVIAQDHMSRFADGGTLSNPTNQALVTLFNHRLGHPLSENNDRAAVSVARVVWMLSRC